MQTRISTSSQFFSLFALGRKGVADFPLLAYAQTESEQTRHFYGLFARLQHCLFDDGRMKIESSILSSPGKELTGYSTVGAEQFYGWSMCSRNYKKKKGTTVFEGGGGGGDGAGVRVRVCQVNVTRITRKAFEILNFVRKPVVRFPVAIQYRLFAHGTEPKTGVAKLDPWSKS